MDARAPAPAVQAPAEPPAAQHQPASGVWCQQQQQQKSQQDQQIPQGQKEHQEEEARPPGFLQLPDNLLQLVLGCLTLAGDLAACAATCAALRALIAGATWPHVAHLTSHNWKPTLRHGLQWAVARCPQLREVDLSGATACCDADLAPLAQLTSLTSLRLAGNRRITGASARADSSSASGGARRWGARRRSAAATAAAGAAAPSSSQSQSLDVLASIVSANPGLLCLDVSGTSVAAGGGLAAALAPLTAEVPNATKPAFGLQELRLAGCPQTGGPQQQQQQQVLRQVLLHCPALTRLELSGCRWLTYEALPERHDAAAAALGLMPVHHASFAGCELLGGIGWLVSSWIHLERLDLSGTAVDDGDVELIASGCHSLQSLSLSGCCRIRGPALTALASSPAMQLGLLTELHLADLPWVPAQYLSDLLCTLRIAAESRVCLDLSGCGGLADSTLRELLPLPSTVAAINSAGLLSDASLGDDDSSSDSHSYSTSSSSSSRGDSRTDGVNRQGPGGYSIKELRLAGSAKVTAAALLQLATARLLQQQPSSPPLLHRLQHLDVSHVRSLSSKQGSIVAASGSSTSSSSSPADGGGRGDPVDPLASLVQAAGGSLRSLLLDGCAAGGGFLPLLARCCPGLTRLSLVGCTGLGDSDLAALSSLRGLRQLAVGGGYLTWHEHRALTGLTGLTHLRIARRPFLTDAQLAPLLAANRGSLVQLDLAGCAGLSDQALLHLLPPAGCQAPAGVHASSSQSLGADEQLLQHSQDQQQQQEQEQEQRAGSAVPQAVPAVRHLSLVCCDRIVGSTLRQLTTLRSLRLGGCPAVEEAALQATAICCTGLTLLEIPSHIPRSSLPVAPAGAPSHLHGLHLVGGTEQSSGKWGKRGGGNSRR